MLGVLDTRQKAICDRHGAVNAQRCLDKRVEVHWDATRMRPRPGWGKVSELVTGVSNSSPRYISYHSGHYQSPSVEDNFVLGDVYAAARDKQKKTRSDPLEPRPGMLIKPKASSAPS